MLSQKKTKRYKFYAGYSFNCIWEQFHKGSPKEHSDTLPCQWPNSPSASISLNQL